MVEESVVGVVLKWKRVGFTIGSVDYELVKGFLCLFK